MAKAENRRIIIAVNNVELAQIASKVGIPVYAQHSDHEEFGKGTGKILPEVIKYHGAKGTLLNHAEFKLTNEVLERCIARAKGMDLEVLACAETVKRAERIAKMRVKPDMIAIEPPELIGGDVSVSTANPEIVRETVQRIKRIAPGIMVLCGAGIRTRQDVETAIRLGTGGVLLASGVVKAADKEKTITELARGL